MESHSWLINPLLTLEYDVAAKFLLSPLVLASVATCTPSTASFSWKFQG